VIGPGCVSFVREEAVCGGLIDAQEMIGKPAVRARIVNGIAD